MRHCSLLITGGVAFGLYGLFTLPAYYLAGNDLLRVAAEVAIFLLGGIFATEAGHTGTQIQDTRGG